MSEFDEKLNALLSNPESIAQIMQLAQSLSGQAGTSGEGGEQPPKSAGAPTPSQQSEGARQTADNPRQPEGAPRSSANAMDALSALAGGLDPKLLARLLPMLSELNSEKDSNASRLLYALRPYLKQERQEKVERALQLARLIHIGKRFLANWEG